jgi:hypothetical protein
MGITVIRYVGFSRSATKETPGVGHMRFCGCFYMYLGGVMSCDEPFDGQYTFFFAADFICLKPCELRIFKAFV